MRTFCTAGPVKVDKHYSIPPLLRWDTNEIYRLIQEEHYFVLHAPRQTGKTTCLLALMEKLNAEGNHTALYVNLESAQAARGDVASGMHIILDSLVASTDQYLGDRLLPKIAQEIMTTRAAGSFLREGLRRWCRQLEKPLVLLLDEVDALVGDTLISLLRQIRLGYPDRPHSFPQTVLLCGVRDYRIHNGDNQIITGGSVFNIKSASLRLGNFSYEDVATLYAQHTEETGQQFETGIIDYVFEQTVGQPWLVNALGYQACFQVKEEIDRNRPITLTMMEEAHERLIERRDTHLDQLADKLREPRVHRVISELLGSDTVPDIESPSEDDLLYVQPKSSNPEMRWTNISRI